METLYACYSKQDSDESDESALLKAKSNNDSEFTAALLIKILISAVEDGNEDIVVSFLDEFLSTSNVKYPRIWWSSDSHSDKQESKCEIWKDVIRIALEKDAKQSEEIMKRLLDCDIIWSLELKMDDLLLRRIERFQKDFNDKNLRLIEMLLKYGKINANARDKKGRTVLHLNKEEKLTSLLIRYGADVNRKDEDGMTPLMAEYARIVPVLQTILKEAETLVDLDSVDPSGQTALMIAASEARPDVVELLLNAGASVNLSDHLGFTALHHALYAQFDHYDNFPRNSDESKKRKEMFTILLDAKDERCDGYMISKDLIAKRIETVEMLLLGKQDIDVNALSFEKFSPLDMAEGWIPQLPVSIETVLKERGAVFSTFKQTETQPSSHFHLDVRCRFALERLVRSACGITGGDKIVPAAVLKKRLLSLIETFKDHIKSGRDQHGRTALHLVVVSFSIMWIVYFEGATLIDNENYPRDLANAIVEKLIEIGCNVNAMDDFGRTPLHYDSFIFKESLINYGADASIKDNDGIDAMNEMPHPSSTRPNSSDIVEDVMNQINEAYFLRILKNEQMKIEVRCADFQITAYDNRKCWLRDVPRLLWNKGEYAFRHPFVTHITNEVISLMSAIAKEFETLDPRFAVRSEFVGSANEGTKIDRPDEFDFCFVLTKVSELCEVSQSPELPTGFVRLKRKPKKAGETSDFDSYSIKDGIMNVERLNCQFAAMLRNAVVNIESRQSLECHLEMPIRSFSSAIDKFPNIIMIKPINLSSVNDISIDIVPCIHVDGWWPDEALSNVSDDITKRGCNLIFDRPHKLYPWVPYSESCARISFSKAESNTIKHSCISAREAYMIGKTMIEEPSWSGGYVLKNCLLYCIEALTPTSEKASHLGLSLEEMKSEFHRMDRYVWLKCLMKCHLEFVLQDFCPCYFLPNFNSPIEENYLKMLELNSITRDYHPFRALCKNAFAFYRCTSNDTSDTCYQFPVPDPLWERFDRNQLIASLCEIAYNDLKM